MRLNKTINNTECLHPVMGRLETLSRLETVSRQVFLLSWSWSWSRGVGVLVLVLVSRVAVLVLVSVSRVAVLVLALVSRVCLGTNTVFTVLTKSSSPLLNYVAKLNTIRYCMRFCRCFMSAAIISSRVDVYRTGNLSLLVVTYYCG